MSSLQAQRILQPRGSVGLFMSTIDEEGKKKLTLSEVRVVQECPDDLPGMPPKREVEFKIDLTHDVAPISKAPYRMALKELQELKAQIEEFLKKGFI